MSSQALVEVDGITVRYGDLTAVDGVSFSIQPGEVVGLLGPNGSGKTSTIKSIAGLVEPVSGTVIVNGYDSRRSYRQVAMSASVVLEGDRNLYWRLTPRENMEYFAALQGIPRKAVTPLIDELVERFRLTDKVNVEVRKLSRGMKQKVTLCCALARQTPLLLLDEPTLGVDVEMSLELRGYLADLAANEGKTLLVSSHDLRVIEALCPRLIVISRGRLVADDRLEHLRRLFAMRSYRFLITNGVDATAEARWRDGFSVRDVRRDDDLTRVDVDLPDSASLYAFMECMRVAGCEVDSIDRIEVDLETIYLGLMNKEVI